MTIYLAARYSRHPEIRQWRDELTAMGYTVMSRWIDCHGGAQTQSCTPWALNHDPESCAHFAQADIADLTAADIVISFTDGASGGKGERHVEFGIAVALGKRLLLIGPREHVFHTLPNVEQFDTMLNAHDLLRLAIFKATGKP